MPHRWVWSLLDIAGLVCLGQATILAQRQAAGPPPRLDAALEVSRPEDDAAAHAARIFEAGPAIVVSLPLESPSSPPKVSVERGTIRLTPRAGGVDEIPVPAGADPARYRVRVSGDELRVIFRRSTVAEGD